MLNAGSLEVLIEVVPTSSHLVGVCRNGLVQRLALALLDPGFDRFAGEHRRRPSRACRLGMEPGVKRPGERHMEVLRHLCRHGTYLATKSWQGQWPTTCRRVML